MLRDYQRRAIDQLYAWFSKNPTGNPCLMLPTGAGKSHIVAALCKEALQLWPETRVLMLTHVKELIGQNAEKMRQHWPGAPMGIYSASLGKRQLGEPITFAGIQSVRTKAQQLGHVDLVIIDECHLVSHKDEGGYRKLIADLREINPHVLHTADLDLTRQQLPCPVHDALVEPVLLAIVKVDRRHRKVTEPLMRDLRVSDHVVYPGKRDQSDNPKAVVASVVLRELDAS